MERLLEATPVTKSFFVDAVSADARGLCFSATKMYPAEMLKPFIKDSAIHDGNFAFLQTTLAKLHKEIYEPLENTTFARDIPVDVGGGFVDYVSYFTVDWAGIMNEFRNVTGNMANYIPRINAGLNQKKVDVYTFEVAYDLRFVDLEKYKQVQLAKSIQQIYNDIIVAGWDLFCEKVAYLGINGKTGLFNSDDKVMVTAIDNDGTTGEGFEGLTDEVIVSFINGIFEVYLLNSNMNLKILPNTILVPTFVGRDLSGRINELYTASLRKFLAEHNLAIDEGSTEKIRIESRGDLNTLGTYGKGRIVAYKQDKRYVRVDMPYPMQHYITLPNIDKMSYTSAFVGQISEVQMPYNLSNEALGPVAYFDFTD